MWCPYSGKQKFPTAAHARKAAEGLMSRSRRGIAKHYQCPTCRDWHIANATHIINPRKKNK